MLFAYFFFVLIFNKFSTNPDSMAIKTIPLRQLIFILIFLISLLIYIIWEGFTILLTVLDFR